MSLLLFKLTLPPLLILVASLVGRRWGDAIGGWMVGLPLTSGPVAAFLAIQYGADFAAVATNGSLIGTAAQAFFCLGYAALAQHGWPAALLAGTVVYGVSAFLIQAAPLPHWGFFAAALAALTLAARHIPNQASSPARIAAPWWDLPARMVVVTALVVTLTAVAAAVGAKVAGVLSGFPIFGTILAIFAHRAKGAPMAIQVLRGMVLALYGFATFFFVLGLLLVKLGILPAFLAALGSTLLVQAGALKIIQRSQVPKAA